MSQIYKSLTSGPVPPSVPTSFTTDVHDNTTAGPGNAVPAANILQLLGGETDQNNSNGIRTDANPNNGNIVLVELTNRFRQTTTTVGAVTSSVTILSALVAGTYTLDMSIAGFATAGGPAGNGYTIVGSVKSDGITASLCGGILAQQKDSFEDVIGANAIMDVSGNTIIVTFTGFAGITFDWLVTGTYILVS